MDLNNPYGHVNKFNIAMELITDNGLNIAMENPL